MLIDEAIGLSKGSEKRVSLKCDNCGRITTTTYANYHRSQEKRNWSGETICRKCVCKISADKRRGKPAHNKGKKLLPSQKGINHASWKGGRYLSNDGYWMIYVGNDGKNDGSGWNSYKKEHVFVVENYLNRKLVNREVIHHIDGDKQNNHIDNLWITSQKGHRNAHISLQEIGYQLLRNGLITFDKKEGIYKCMT